MSKNIKHTCCVFLLMFIAFVYPTTGSTETTALHQSVEKALSTNPQLQILDHNRQALTFDLKQSRSRYLPKVDLTLGYGTDQHSDRTTRAPNAKPDDNEWDARENATLKMTQQIYDGGETGSQVAIGEAQVEAASHRLQAARQAVALEAVTAHLDVVRQGELVALSEKNLKVHHDIYQLLAEREQAGAGSIADVDQVQARMARAETTLHSSQAELAVATANYVRVVGSPPEALAFAGAPETLPLTLEAVLMHARQKNPELMALVSEHMAADSSLMLARSKYRPKLDLELSSKYNNQVEGDPSWEATNTAMLSLHWNLYNGGNDKAGTQAALARLEQSLSKRTAKWDELTESISTTWATRHAFQRQKEAYRNAVVYSRNTYDAYLNQFSISKRTLLDVLIAQNDFFQSAAQLVEVTINEIIAAYRIMTLMGELDVPRCEGACAKDDGFKDLSSLIAFPSALGILSVPSDDVLQEQDNETEPIENASQNSEIISYSNQSVEIGPLIRHSEVSEVRETLNEMGLSARQESAVGPVTMFRLLEGIYPPAEARERLAVLKKVVGPAFILPQGDGLGIIIGSFRNSQRAQRYKEELGRQQIQVEIVTSAVQMRGTLLVVDNIDMEIAEQLVQQMSKKMPSTTVNLH